MSKAKVHCLLEEEGIIAAKPRQDSRPVGGVPSVSLSDLFTSLIPGADSQSSITVP
jgi:hypothetical protein